ncbi:MAG: histidine--tRNA ligase [Endomicrobiia bacterium]
MFSKKVRGVRDILPDEAKKIDYIEEICQTSAKKFGFKKVILPIIENLQLFYHTLGQTSDIVEKQMFIIQSRSSKETDTLTLRPEGTAGMVRFFVENNIKNKYPLKRFFYSGPMFRYERPQKGRYREFYQFGFEIFDEAPVSSDVILISLINEILKKLSIEYVLEINSIGCINCRPKLLENIKKELKKIENILCDVCKIKLEKNPLRILDCKMDISKIEETDVLKNINFIENICNECKENFEDTIKLFDYLSINYKINTFIVRGLDYYNGLVFEYKSFNLNAAQNTICAGGRYDFLVKQFDTQINYACGAALGIDRVAELLSENFKDFESKTKIGIAIVDDKYIPKSFEILNMISKNLKDFSILGPFIKRSLKSQLRLFNSEGCRYVIIIGDEIKENKVIIKDFTKNFQKILKLEELPNSIYEI